MAVILKAIDETKPDATFDLDGTEFKFTVIEAYTEWLCNQQVFDPLPRSIAEAKLVWKEKNDEANFNAHLGELVMFFIEQVKDKPVSLLNEAAEIVADQQAHRRWNITTNIINHLQPTHNVMAISLMPEWLMGPFTRDLGFIALIGSTYVTKEGKFTDEAYSIKKDHEYLSLRRGKSNLDIHMGDTVGDISLFNLARRPIPFNPSWTLFDNAHADSTKIISHKDMVTVINKDAQASVYGAPFDIDAILAQISVINSVELS